MAEEYKIELSAELRDSSITGIETRINNLRNEIQSNPIQIRLNTTQVTRQIASIRRQIEALSNIRITLSDGNGGGTRSVNNIRTTTLAYRELMSVIKQMGSVQTKIAGLDSSKNSSQINSLSSQLDRLREKYTNLRTTFDQSFDVGQLVGIETEMQKIASSIDLVNSKMADKSAANTQKSTIADVTAQYKQLLEIQSQIGSARIKRAGLNSETDSHQIQQLSEQITRLTTEYNTLFDSVNRSLSTQQLDNLTNGFDRINNSVDIINAKMADTAALKQQTEAYKELMSIATQMDKLELKIGGLRASGGNENQITTLTQQLETLRSEYQSLMTTMQGSLSTQQLSNLGNSFAELQNKLAALDAQALDVRRNLFNSIKTDITEGTLGNNLDTIVTRFNSLNVESVETTNNIETLRSLLRQMDSSDDIESVISDYEQFNSLLTTVTNRVDTLQRGLKTTNDAAKLQDARTALSSEIDVWLKNNSAAASQFGAKLQEIKAKIATADSASLSHLKAEFQEVTRQANIAGVATQSMGDKFKAQMSKLGTYFSASFVILRAIQTIKGAVNNVVELDTALVDLQKTSSATSKQLQEFYYSANETAKKLGQSTKDVIQAAADWSRLGYSLEDSKKMAEISSIFTSISPDLNMEQATDGLVSAMKAFHIEADEALDGIASKINIIGKYIA